MKSIQVKNSIILMVLAVVSLYSASYAGGPLFTIHQDIMCPPQPSSSGTEPQCPDGYTVSPVIPEETTKRTGFYACIPVGKLDSSAKYRVCTYYNKNCISKDIIKQRKQDEEYDNKTLSYYTELAGNKTTNYGEKLLQLVTFDPKFVSKVRSESGKSNSSYLFFADSFDEAVDYVFHSSLVYFFFGAGWLALVLGSTIVIRKEQLEHPFIIGGRVLTGLMLFFIPLPHSGVKGRTYWQPLSFDAVRTVIYLGNDMADGLATKLDGVFIKRAVLDMNDASTLNKNELRSMIKAEGDVLNSIEKQMKVCKEAYNGADFIVDDGSLGEAFTAAVPNTEPNYTSAVKKACDDNGVPESKMMDFSRRGCKQIEIRYKGQIHRYNSDVIMYNGYSNEVAALPVGGTTVGAIIKNPESYLGSGSTKNERAIATAVVEAKKLGWISYPLVVLPMSKLAFAFHKEALLGPFSPHDPHWILRTLVFISLPPGNMIFQTLITIVSKCAGIMEAVTGVAGAYIGSSFGPIGTAVGSIAGGIAGKIAVSLAGGAAALALTYYMVKAFFEVFPILAINLALIFRVVPWLVDVAKIMLVSPFVALHSMSVKRYEGMYTYVRRLGVVALMPMMFIISVFLAYFAVNITDILVYGLTMKTMATVNAMKDSISYKYLMFYPVEGLAFYASLIAQAIVGYKIVMNAPEWFLETAGFKDLGHNASTGIGREITEVVTRKSGSPV